MPTIVTATELRTILGVSSSLYPDAYLNDIVDASENLVLPMLVTFQSKINKVKLRIMSLTLRPQRFKNSQKANL